MELDTFKKALGYAAPLVSVVGLSLIGAGAFSRGVRNQMLRRDGGCVVDDDLCLGGLEASHFDHDKSAHYYNHPDNGEILCSYHHGIEHEETEGCNGLSVHHNRWALLQIAGRVSLHIVKLGGWEEHYDFVERNFEP